MATTDIKIAGDRLPIIRYVYLVEDAENAARMLGTSANVYTTSQSAYDQANILQVLLGGSTKVVVLVGNTTAATVGGIALTANYNSNVEWVGLSSNNSIIGTVSAGTFALNIRFTNLSVGVLSSSTGSVTVNANNCILSSTIVTTGGAISLTLRDTTTGVITALSTTTASSNITITGCSASTIGTITQNATVGDVGSLIMTNCTDLTVGAITRNQLSTTASFNIGAFTLTSCSDIRFGAVTSTMAYSLGTGTITGININNTNTGIFFSAVFTMQGYNVDATSDVVITSVSFNNCTFASQLLVNASGGAFISTAGRGGRINTLVLTNCNLGSITRFGYIATTLASAGNVDITSCFGGPASRIAFLTENVTLASFNVRNCHTETIFEIVQYNGSVVDNINGTFSFEQCTFAEMNLSLYSVNGTYAIPVLYMNKVICPTGAITWGNENSNFEMRACDFSDELKINEGSGLPFTQPSYIYNSSIRLNMVGTGTINPYFIVYNSLIDGDLEDATQYVFEAHTSTLDFASFCHALATYDITGAVNTSNLYILATATQSVTNNNSYIV